MLDYGADKFTSVIILIADTFILFFLRRPINFLHARYLVDENRNRQS
jgi:hypothetical protein